jgi:hypothetical protein
MRKASRSLLFSRASPLTLTLSPHAGRGDVPDAVSTHPENGAATPSPRLRGEGGGSRMRGRATDMETAR